LRAVSPTNNTSHYGVLLANKGLQKVVETNEAFAVGVNTHDGFVTHEKIADTHNLYYKSLSSVFAENLVHSH
jgi:alanine dehydrogenase